MSNYACIPIRAAPLEQCPGLLLPVQVQERLSHQVADAVVAALGAAAVLVVVDSAHMCMVARGVEKHASTTLTTASRGLWAGDALARARAMEVLLAS